MHLLFLLWLMNLISARLIPARRYAARSSASFSSSLQMVSTEGLGGANLQQDLKTWRKRTSDELQKPVFKILTNDVIDRISARKPKDLQQLALLNGMGPARLRQYGKKIIEIVRYHHPSDDDEALVDDISDLLKEENNKFWDNVKKVKKETKKTTKKKTDITAETKPRRRRIKTLSEDEIQNLPLPKPVSYEELNTEQQDAATHILSGNNVFITGSAGTGKSFLLKYVIQELVKIHGEEAVAVTAPTGISAVNINGQTIHSFAGIGLGKGDPLKILSKVMKSKTNLERWQQIKVLVIDEISMVDKDLFELLNIIAMKTRENDMCFGGIQLIAVGDFMQLPPVSNKNSKDLFCFHSHVWEAAGFNIRKGTIHLNKVERQKDLSFVNFLNEVRLGKISPQFLSLLEECKNKPYPTNGIIPTKLYCTNIQVDNENLQRLAELPTETVTLLSEDKWKIKPIKDTTRKYMLTNMETKIPEQLDFKVGAQVMLLRNRSKMTHTGYVRSNGLSLVNGSRGKIVAFSESAIRPGTMVPTVEFDNGLVTTIGPVDYTYKMPNGEGELIRSQVPLKLAWAATVHKSQGQTLTCAELQLDRAFDYGQIYVALSRVKGLDGLWLSAPIKTSAIKAHPDVLRFYGYI